MPFGLDVTAGSLQIAKAAVVALRAAQNAGQIFFDIFSRASFFYQKISRLQNINPNIKDR